MHAVYAVLSQGVGKFELQAGLRGEYADRDFGLTNTGQRYPYQYNSLFPSGIVMYNLTPATQLKASYSRRIRRPGTQELNPFVTYFDVRNVFIGNPALSPEYTNALELGLTRNLKRGSVQFSPFYRQTTNIIRVDIDSDRHHRRARGDVRVVPESGDEQLVGRGPQRLAAARSQAERFRRVQRLQDGDGRRLDEQPRFGRIHVDGPREHEQRGHEDADAAGLLFLSRADEDREAAGSRPCRWRTSRSVRS